MQKVNFYLLPFVSYDGLTDEAVQHMQELIECIKDNEDIFVVPNSFYSCEDESNKTFFDFLEGEDNSVKRLIREMICYNPHIEKSYEELYEDILNEFNGYVAQEKKTAPEEAQEYVTCEKSNLVTVYRHMAKRLSTYEEYYAWRKKCFPRLLFTKDAFDKASHMGILKLNVEEMLKCMGCLNDMGYFWYKQYGEPEALAKLQAASGVACTGKGSNETLTFKKKVELYDADGNKHICEISCIPHFKLETKYSDKRVHFSWGKEQINDHSIIVVHIGPHWSSSNENVATIEGAEYKSMS